MDRLLRIKRTIRVLFIFSIATVIAISVGGQLFSTRTFSLIHSLPTRTTSPAFVITLPDQKQRLSTVISLFRKYAGLTLSPYDAIDGNQLPPSTEDQSLKPGERGLRETMKRFFAMALERDYSEVFVFEDDAIPHLNFTQLFKRLPSRCQEADVLLLGASMWLPEEENWPLEACFDARIETVGAFGLLIKKSAFLPILTWLKIGPALPWDLAFRELQRQQLIVRVAYSPFLVIPDITHPSSVDPHREVDRVDVHLRAERNDWHFENYPVFSL